MRRTFQNVGKFLQEGMMLVTFKPERSLEHLWRASQAPSQSQKLVIFLGYGRQHFLFFGQLKYWISYFWQAFLHTPW